MALAAMIGVISGQYAAAFAHGRQTHSCKQQYFICGQLGLVC